MSKTTICIAALVCLMLLVSPSSAQRELLREVLYESENPLSINLDSSREVTVNMLIDETSIPIKGADLIAIKFRTSTISVPFQILSLDPKSIRVLVNTKSLEAFKYLISAKLKLHANYIGHAVLEPVEAEFIQKDGLRTTVQQLSKVNYRLPVIIDQDEGVWGTIFIVSVVTLMIITYINLGAQLDEENMRLVIKKPLTLVLGFLVSVLVMPLISWFIGKMFFSDYTLFRIGSFVFACSPAATASTLWTVMLNSDKELSIGLQVLSNIGALVTMPGLLYIMERSLKSESPHHIAMVPYSRLVQVLFVLLISLLIGWRFVGRNEKSQKIATKISRPLIFSVLIFIIVFSSILYWHIYRMFNLTVMLAAFLITLTTYIVAGLLGYLINFDLSRAVAISISSAYKNSGITFAVLLVAFGAPDTYIAFVPSLAQIIITSLSLYLIYTFKSLAKCICNRVQGDSMDVVEEGKGTAVKKLAKKRNSSQSENAGNDPVEGESEENDEFLEMNVTDIDSELPDKKSSIDSGQQVQTEIKVIASADTEETRALRSNDRPVSDI